MLSAFLPTTRRARRTAKATWRSNRKTNLTAWVERLEDRTLLTTAPLFIGLGVLPGDVTSFAWDVTDDGETVVGYSFDEEKDPEAFRWTKESGMEGLGVLQGADESWAYSVSADGSVIAGYSNGAGSNSFRRTENQGMVEIPDLPGDQGISHRGATGVSSDGTVIVGAAPSSNGREAYTWRQGATIEAAGETIGLGDLAGGNFESRAWGVSDESSVVGWGTNADNRRQAFIARPSLTSPTEIMPPMALVDTGIESEAYGISNDGSVVVGRDATSQETRGRGRNKSTVNIYDAFRWTESAGMEHLGDLPGGNYYSEARAVSADGSVIAGLSDSSDGTEAFIWDATNEMRSLQDVLASDFGLADELAGWQLQVVRGMTPDGSTFVGEGLNPEGMWEAFVARIPELGEPPPMIDIHVHDLDATTNTGRGGKWNAGITTTIRDTAESPIDGALITGTFSGGASGSVSCTTNAQGSTLR